MNPEEFTRNDMFGAWIFLGIVAAAGLGIGRLFEHYRNKR
jgi:hypothetical protein